MGTERCKRKREDDEEDELQHQDHTAAPESELSFHILELPMHLVYDILSRLPPKTIFCCRCVCKTFLKIFADPYFAEIHLIKAPDVAASLILQDSSVPSFHFVYMLDLDKTSSASSYSNNHHPSRPHCHPHLSQASTVQNTKFQFYRGKVTLVGSCNGLLCLAHSSLTRPSFYICNPVLGELLVLPRVTSLTPVLTSVEDAGFGFCPKTKKYKVICLISSLRVDPMTNVFSTKRVAEIYTLGTESWRSIGDAPFPRTRGTWVTFDSFINGNIHWITDSVSASNLIRSFDFETEQFRYVPSPTHFDQDYINKISWITVGVLGEYLCLCYVLVDTEFDVWVMKDYGAKESWTKEFVIDIKFYCGLKVANLLQPVKFLKNGDLLFVHDSYSIVCFSPRKGTFRDFKALGTQNMEAVAHIPSFVSLKDIARGKMVVLVKRKTREGMHINVLLTR